MGMFDKVNFKCEECGGVVEFQSKAGDCSLDEFTQDKIPVEVANDIANDVAACKECGATYKPYPLDEIPTVKMRLAKVYKNDDDDY